MPRKIVIYLEKGGVGKTMTAIHLAHALAILGKKVLLIDLDRQDHCRSRLGLKSEESPSLTLAKVMMEGWPSGMSDMEKLKSVIMKARENLYLIPGSKGLSSVIFDLPKKDNCLQALANSLGFLDASSMDFIIMDTNPSWNPLSANALLWGDELIYPVKTSSDDLISVAHFQGELNRIRELRDGELRLVYVLPTMFEKGQNEATEIVNILAKHFPNEICAPIPKRVRLQECGGRGQTIFEYAADNDGAEAYMEFAKRVLAGGKDKEE